jgi:2-amino-4-hydroxy-6-hydroxymethyldihydropteridine diphosphokinase
MSATNATSVPRQEVKKAFRKFIYDNFKFSKVHNSHSNKKVSLCGESDMSKSVFLLLGTNLGDRIDNLNEALKSIQQGLGTIAKLSSVYETSAWGKTDQPAFLNLAAEVTTTFSPEHVLNYILSIEGRMGRERKEKWGERIIDIDILFYDHDVYHLPHLVVPHPQVANRRFTLTPLNEIAPTLIHPILKRTIADLLADCPDNLGVTQVEGTSFLKSDLSGN